MTLPEAALPTSPPVVPLARARDGAPIPLPDGGAAWRVRRHTGGRPRLHLDGSKQPTQLSLWYTMADLDDILPPGAYKLDLVDRTGAPLGSTVDVEIGALHLVMRGASLKAVKELLGHSSIQMTMRYAHLAPEVVNETVRLLDGPTAEWVPDGVGQRMGRAPDPKTKEAAFATS